MNLKKNPHRMGEDICKQSNWHGINLQNIQATHVAQQPKSKQPNQNMGWNPQ